MKYLKKEYPSFNLHMINTDRFKTVNLEIIFGRKIKKEEITITNFLSSILVYTTKKYNTKLKFGQKMEDLYATRAFTNCYRIGNIFNVDFNLKFLNPKYSDENIFNDALDFLKEIIFNPNIKNNEFDENSFNVVKNNEISRIMRLKEDKRGYSKLRLLELTDKDAPFSYNMKGYLEDLEKVTRKNLYDFYKEFLKSNKVDIYVVGNIDFKETERLITSKFSFENNKEFIEHVVKWNNKRCERREFIEKDNTNQAKLTISCRTKEMTEYERLYVSSMYHLILGGTADSKFFKNIREKFSLCYYISSSLHKADNILLISSGITKDNYSKIMTLIDKEMNDMRKGLFDEEDIDKAKRFCLSTLDQIEDNPNEIISSYYSMDLLKIKSIDEMRKTIMTVTKDDIVKLSNKIEIDTVLLLGGDKK